MKNILEIKFSSTLLFLLLQLSVFAQMSIGPKIGMSYCNDWISNSKYADYQTIISKEPYYGMNAGLSLILENESVARFHLEFMYSKVGSKYLIKDVQNSYIETFSLVQDRSYIKSNILLDIGREWSEYPNFRIYGQVGFYVASLQKATTTIASRQIIDANLRYWDGGFVSGFAVAYKIGRAWISINPRISLGIIPYRSVPAFIFNAWFFNANGSVNIAYHFIIK